MGAAECTAAAGIGYSRQIRPGKYSLLGEKVSWLRGNDERLGLDPEGIDRLAEDMNRGISFRNILRRLEDIRRQWRRQLGQKPLPGSEEGVVTQVTDSSWEAEVGASNLPVLVIFGMKSDRSYRKELKIIEKLSSRYSGKLRFLTAEPPQAQKIFRQERIRVIPVIQLYREGSRVDEREGFQNEAALVDMIETHIPAGTSSRGLLGIEMDQPVW